MPTKKQRGHVPKVSAKLLIKDFISGIKLNAIAYKYGLSTECVRMHVLADGEKKYQQYKRMHRDNLKKQMLKKFLAISKKLKCIPTPFEARQHGIKCSDENYTNFRKQAEKRGYIFQRLKKTPVYSDKQLFDNLKTLAWKLGHTPTAREIKAEGTISHITYRNRFGSLTKAQQKAGLKPNKQGGSRQRSIKVGHYISEEDCVRDLEKITFMLGHFPASSELKKHGKYSYDTYRKRLGGIKMLNKHLKWRRERKVA